MPNFFVEAVTVHGGKSHVVTRELFVPPAKRVLNVEVAPSAEAYLPGQAAKVLLKLTDEQGEPYVGSLALSIYDKAVEYIAAAANVADIFASFSGSGAAAIVRMGETNLQRIPANVLVATRTSLRCRTWDYVRRNRPRRRLVHFDLRRRVMAAMVVQVACALQRLRQQQSRC